MKKLLVVAALLGVMLIAGNLKVAGASSAATLAGIGFVMLSAYALAELGKSVSLPQVTGYILAGIVLGPSVGGIISGEVVNEMRMFNTLALGLIATNAGLELDVGQVMRLGKTLLLTTLIKVLVGVSLVAGTFLAIESSLESLGLQDRGELVSLALVLGVLSVGTSPSITLAVVSETRAKGRLSELVLGAAVFKDLVVVIGLAVAVAISQVLLEPGSTLNGSVMQHVAVELIGSLGAGALVGAILILYLRFIGAEMLLFVAAMILVVAELCRAFHLELLLVFISAGFVVRNFSKFTRQLMHPLELVALPVFVVFFANAGASIDLVTTWKILPLALGLCAARAASFILASRLGGKWAGESPIIQRQAWLAYLPQAGVTLGLVGLAGLQLPALVTQITNTGMAVVALNLLIGPITLRRALRLAGELPNGEGEAAAVRTSPQPSPLYASPTPASSSLSTSGLPVALGRAYEGLALAVHEVLERFALEARLHLPTVPALRGEVPSLDVFRPVVEAHRLAYQSLYVELDSVLGQLPLVVRIAPPARGPQEGSHWAIKRARNVPLRRLGRIALAPAIAHHVARCFEKGLLGGAAPEPALPVTVETGGQRNVALPPELVVGLSRLVELMRDAGTRRLRARQLRYSSVEPQVRRQLQSLHTTQTDLVRLARAAWGSERIKAERRHITTNLRNIVARCVARPALIGSAKVNPAVTRLADWLDERSAAVGSARLSASELTRLRAEFEELTKSVLEDLSREFRFATTVRKTLAEMKVSVAAVPTSMDCLLVARDGPGLQGKIQVVELRGQVEALIRHIMAPLDLAARSVSTALSQVRRRVDDAIRPEWQRLEAQVDLALDREAQPLTKERLARARSRLEPVTLATTHAIRAALEALERSVDSACAAFNGDMLLGPSTQDSRDSRLHSQLAGLRLSLSRLTRGVRLAVLGSPGLEDAAAVQRAFIKPQPVPLPASVERWFEAAPVTDQRIFTAHRKLLDRVLDAESSRAEKRDVSVLIIGSKGSGKSSLLNMCELELPSASHLRLHASDFTRETRLFEALGNLLECPPTHAAVCRHLALRSPAIFVDDLGSWVSASLDRQLELQRVLSLIAETRHCAYWVVSVDSSLLRLFSEMDAVEEVFSHVLRLPALSLPELKRMVSARLELSNLDVTFEPSRGGHLLERFGPSSAGDGFYRTLLAASAGSPARVVALCREALTLNGRKAALRTEAIPKPVAPDHNFTEVQLAILATLHRYGPRSLDGLQREVAVSAASLRRSVAFLSSCGLVCHVDEGHALSISEPAAWVVFSTLVSAQLAVA